MNFKLIENFINDKIYAFIISTNYKKTKQHETYLLAYTFTDLLNGRYSEFWSKLGGYKEPVILFPSYDLEIVPENSDIKTVKLYKTVNDFKKYVEKCKNDNIYPSEFSKKSRTLDENYYNPDHMYLRHYLFGSFVKDSPLNKFWNVKINGINVDGFEIRDFNFIKQFGKVFTFNNLSTLIQKYMKKLLNEKTNDNDDDDEKLEYDNNDNENNDNDDDEKLEYDDDEKLEYDSNEINIINDSNEEMNDNEKIQILKINIVKLSDKINILHKQIKLLKSENKNYKIKLKDAKIKYSKALQEERNMKKIEVKREQTITKRIQKELKKLNNKYTNDIEKYENKINELENDKKCMSDSMNQNENSKIIKASQKKIIIKQSSKNNYVDIILTLLVFSILINIVQYVYKIYGIW